LIIEFKAFFEEGLLMVTGREVALLGAASCDRPPLCSSSVHAPPPAVFRMLPRCPHSFWVTLRYWDVGLVASKIRTQDAGHYSPGIHSRILVMAWHWQALSSLAWLMTVPTTCLTVGITLIPGYDYALKQWCGVCTEDYSPGMKREVWRKCSCCCDTAVSKHFYNRCRNADSWPLPAQIKIKWHDPTQQHPYRVSNPPVAGELRTEYFNLKICSSNKLRWPAVKSWCDQHKQFRRRSAFSPNIHKLPVDAGKRKGVYLSYFTPGEYDCCLRNKDFKPVITEHNSLRSKGSNIPFYST